MVGERERIAILGGGPAALATAFYLTSTPETRARYEVTIYQMGFRLGGKTVSGRGEHDRIEEHGLHILFGCYESLFTLMRECYDELAQGRASAQFARWEDALEPAHFGVVGNLNGDEFEPFYMHFPRGSGSPGDGHVLPRSIDYGKMLLQLVLGIVSGGELASRAAMLAGWGPLTTTSAGEPSAEEAEASWFAQRRLRALRRALAAAAEYPRRWRRVQG